MNHKFKKMMGYFLGPYMRVVIIHDFELAKKIAYSDTYSGRLIGMYTTTMRGYGRPTGGIWNIISEEAGLLMTSLKDKFDGQDIRVDQTFNISVFNILWRIVANKRYNPDDPEILELMQVLAKVFKNAYIEEIFPILQYVGKELYGHSVKEKLTRTNKAVFEAVIKEHKDKLSSKEQPEDFIDAYLTEMSVNDKFTKEDLVGLCMDFFEAGGETVGSTLSWTLLYLANHPDIQEQCREEVKARLGVRVPTLEDRGHGLTFVEATIMEVQRCSSVAPGGLEHKALEDTIIEGYHVKKGTLLYYNIHSFFNDKSYWGDPENFRPERFLDESGSGLKKYERFIPFGFGKRVCMGESLAKAELFIFTIMILQHLRIKLSPNHSKPDPNAYEAGITRSPAPFYVQLEAL
eukprot:maker-scaffold224_size251237-snap-gene-1.46 protein:Tk05456 transcript:maker-scaffold224_size251237-snap-gene-1.46-mRNA-1 annotation:"cytochrome p450 monooxygenase"